MSIERILFSYGMAGIFLTMILYILFAQITVRKLRKNPQTKDSLGLEFMSGWDVFNVAGALSTPAWLIKKFSQSRLSGFTANHQFLYENTGLFDRVLARVFWFFYVVSGSLMILLVVLDLLGVFD